jgi:hypothetical protein
MPERTVLELVANEIIRHAETLDDPDLPDALDFTVSLKQVPGGAELSFSQVGIPDAIPFRQVRSRMAGVSGSTGRPG